MSPLAGSRNRHDGAAGGAVAVARGARRAADLAVASGALRNGAVRVLRASDTAMPVLARRNVGAGALGVQLDHAVAARAAADPTFRGSRFALDMTTAGRTSDQAAGCPRRAVHPASRIAVDQGAGNGRWALVGTASIATPVTRAILAPALADGVRLRARPLRVGPARRAAARGSPAGRITPRASSAASCRQGCRGTSRRLRTAVRRGSSCRLRADSRRSTERRDSTRCRATARGGSPTCRATNAVGCRSSHARATDGARAARLRSRRRPATCDSATRPYPALSDETSCRRIPGGARGSARRGFAAAACLRRAAQGRSPGVGIACRGRGITSSPTVEAARAKSQRSTGSGDNELAQGHETLSNERCGLTGGGRDFASRSTQPPTRPTHTTPFVSSRPKVFRGARGALGSAPRSRR